VLGNSPCLPVDDLGVLDNQLTIGVNRIASVFTPTVLMWVDGNIYKQNGNRTDHAGLMDKCGALLLCDRSVKDRAFHIGLKANIGVRAHKELSKPTTLNVDGNTGCGAARWAVSMGCYPVYLLGMEARYVDGQTNFWGRNRWHRMVPGNSTLDVLRRELERLLGDYPSSVFPVPSGAMLRSVAENLPPYDQEDLRQAIRGFLAASGVEISLPE